MESTLEHAGIEGALCRDSGSGSGGNGTKYQAGLNEIKSPQRDEAAAFDDNYKYY